jgi:hypothetical protein
MSTSPWQECDKADRDDVEFQCEVWDDNRIERTEIKVRSRRKNEYGKRG